MKILQLLKKCLKLKKKMKNSKKLSILKKALSIFILGKINSTSIDNFITEHKDKSNIKTMCKIFGLPRSTYHDQINRKPFKKSLENKKLKI